MDVDQVERRIKEIEQQLLRDEPELGRQFAKLDSVNRLHETTVFTLLVSSAVFLMIGLATMSVVAWLIGVVSFAGSFAVDARHQRHPRAGRRPDELAHCSRPDKHRPRDGHQVDGSPWR